MRDWVERCCGHARTFAAGLAAAGVEILNEVSLNRVLAALPTGQDVERSLQSTLRSLPAGV